jgi:hypothetical protein
LRPRGRRRRWPASGYRSGACGIRTLTFATQTSPYQETPWYLRPDGSLDLAKLLAEFQEFWREDGHLAAEGFHYREAGPHLELMAFLQRVVNGGGRVEREYGLGRGRLDLTVEWRGERQLIELKLRRGKRAEEKALAQLARYLDGAGLAEGWLVLFDLHVEIEGKRITVLGC